jgi:hypothetical protein
MKHLNQKKNNFESVNMTVEEKQRISNHLQALVALTPESIPSFIQLIQSPIRITRVKVAVFAAMVLFVLSAGISFAASKALPGDSLYTIKTNVNEKLEAFLITNPEAKAAFEAQVAFRRLEEAEELGALGRLDANSKAEIESNFFKHTANLDSNLNIIASGNSGAAAQISGDFQSGLKAHRNVLRRLAADAADGAKVHLSILAGNVEDEIQATSSAKLNTAASLNNSEEQGRVKKIEGQIEARLRGALKADTNDNIEINSSADENNDNQSENDQDFSNSDNVNTVVNIVSTSSIDLGH